MKYNETKYYGTKKELRKYLQTIQIKAKSNIDAEFYKKRKIIEDEIYAEIGLTEFLENDLPKLEPVLRKLQDIIYSAKELDTVDMYSQGFMFYAVNGLSSVQESIYNYTTTHNDPRVARLLTERSNALKQFQSAWDSVLIGIVGQSKRIHLICKQLEEEGFDLSDYYEQQLKKLDINKPVVKVDMHTLGIDKL